MINECAPARTDDEEPLVCVQVALEAARSLPLWGLRSPNWVPLKAEVPHTLKFLCYPKHPLACLLQSTSLRCHV